ncbi:precorrin-3B C17-methyltransferase, partial [mine drainage metagenome]
NVALVASGDPGIYALATLVLELKNELPLEDRQSSSISVLPGVTAGLSAASLLGAPLGHDHCYISLSDLMTPWKIIRKRIEAAAEADFGIVFYNPRSKERNWQLNEALTIIAASRPGTTPIGIVKDAYRPNQEVIVTTLDEINTDIVTMTTTVVVGSSTTFIVD